MPLAWLKLQADSTDHFPNFLRHFDFAAPTPGIPANGLAYLAVLLPKFGTALGSYGKLPDSSTQTEHRRVGLVFDAKVTSLAESGIRKWKFNKASGSRPTAADSGDHTRPPLTNCIHRDIYHYRDQGKKTVPRAQLSQYC